MDDQWAILLEVKRKFNNAAKAIEKAEMPAESIPNALFECWTFTMRAWLIAKGALKKEELIGDDSGAEGSQPGDTSGLGG